MAQGTGIGIDIGAATVHVVKVRVAGRDVQVLGSATFRCDSLGVDAADPDAVARAAAAKAAEQGVDGAPALCGLSGRQVILRYLHAAPQDVRWAFERDVREASGASLAEFAVAVRALDVPSPASDQAVHVAAAARRDLLAARSAALAAGGLPVAGFAPSSVALFHILARSTDAEPRGTQVLLDIGAEKTHVVVARDGRFVFARSLMHGGDKFTQATARALGVGDARAEEIKCRQGAVLAPRDIVRRGEDARFYDALRGVADELAGAVQSALTYARAQTGLDEIEPTGYHLCGGGARLDGLREYLEAAWATPVRWLDLGGWLARAQQVADPPSPFGVALGLALAAAEPQALALRLLPEAMERQQRFWRRTAFAAVAALLALLAVGVDAVGVMGEERTQHAHLAALRDAVRESDEAAERIRQQMQRIEDVRRKATLAADRARPNAVVLRTLDVLRRAAPAGITIESLRGAAEAARPAGAGPARVVLALKGVVERRGTATAREELDRFAARLRGEPLRASIDRVRTVGEATPDRAAFEIVLAPSPAPVDSP